MDSPVSRLFHELADLSPTERLRILAERQIEPGLRAEVESLLSFDSSNDDLLTGGICEAAEDVLEFLEREPGECGPYRLVRRLGSGGMGAVYLAERADGELQQQVAIKFLLAGADRPAWRERFLKERQLLASLNHPAIARVIDAGRTRDGRPYLIMEYVDGVPIDVYAAGQDLREQLALFLRVCDGVAHAHRHLIIHRDLKPSNILVDASGQPKLLDFGIAKLLDETDEPTRTMERMMTPGYASPEQVRGESQTTATDVYSLGAVLEKLLAGARPKDVACILRKAQRPEPEERYRSVEAFANDIRAFLEWRPVDARSGNTWYHARKFLRRYWVPVAAAAVAISGLAVGLEVAHRQQALAEKRFTQVRRLAAEVLKLDGVLQRLPGASEARSRVVAMSATYLDGLGPDARKDPELALEAGRAYVLLARAQGVPTAPNLGRYAEAAANLKKGDELLTSVLAVLPRDRRALLAAAETSHDRMILAQTDHHNDEALALARQTIDRTEALLALGAAPAEKSQIARILFDVGLAHKNMHRYADAISYARRAVAIGRSAPGEESRVGGALSLLADALRLTGDLDGALSAIRESRAIVAKSRFKNRLEQFSTSFSTLWREGLILGQEGGISLGRPDEAVVVLQQAFETIENWAQVDSNSAAPRVMFASAGREFGAILAERDPRRALAVYDESIARLREIANNMKALRGEAQLLAGSSYALRRLHRTGEARQRIDAAFRILRETKDYPAERISPDDEAQAALRALADYQSETGQTAHAAALYQELLDKIVAYRIDPDNDLSHATKLSSIYGSLAALDERIGQHGKAEALASRRLALWRHWGEKLPGSAFVRRQLAAAADLRNKHPSGNQ